MTDETMPNGAPASRSEVWELYRQTQDDLRDRHDRLRQALDEGFARLAAKLDAHADDDRRVEHRVTIIETQREAASKHYAKRATLIGSIAGALATIVWHLLQRLFGSAAP